MTFSRVLCYVFCALVSVLLISGLSLFLYESYYETKSCGLSKEFIEIVNLNNQESNVTKVQNQTQPDIDFTGRYKLVKSENFDKFLEELGVGFLQRTLANRATPEYDITKDGEYYTLKTISQFKTSKITFKLNGEEFEENRLDGVRVKSSIVQKGNKWIHKQVGDDTTVTIVREFKGDSIIVMGTLKNINFVRVMQRIKE